MMAFSILERLKTLLQARAHHTAVYELNFMNFRLSSNLPEINLRLLDSC